MLKFREHGEPGTRLRVREAMTAGYPPAGGVEGATRAPRIDSYRQFGGNLSSEHGEREGEAPAALPLEGATRVPGIE